MRALETLANELAKISTDDFICSGMVTIDHFVSKNIFPFDTKQAVLVR